ncbi:murein biosynthesis integral membrane protein MurJ [Tissierella pigra]|uniref:Probable lipid II flippase MurJ n=1 Tax=Tissierella pigra TaxID=2607614 RepID=A0A6N7XDU8_9FIRM|nr:murein biosynthesis integral membrane protein MurJ [Tissierella pigra]MSU00209.1 murein biosynthesis integral membrane protein MurJ [Tissierella pigra]
MSKKREIAGNALMISIFTLISKGLGFIREVMIANKFGSGMETDTYFVAITATVIIMTTLGAALNTTLIPIFSEIGEKHGRRGKLKYLNNILNIVFIITIFIVIFGYIFSPWIIKVLANGFQGEQFELAVKLNRIGLPIAIFLGINYVFSGLLNSSQIFGPPAISGLPYNFVFLIYLFFFANEGSIITLMIVSVIAALLQLLILVPAVHHMGYRYSPNVNLRDKYLKRAMVLIGPVLIGSAVQQINVVIDKTLASGLIEGSISALNYASKINDMVIAVFIMAITTVIFPMLSQAFSQNNNEKVKEILGQGVNIILIVTVPATIGLLILAEPMVYLFFQRNAFDELATYMTSQALIFYSIGLIGASLRLMLNRVYYSLQDTKTPMINGIIAVIINLVLNLVLIEPMGHAGLALATSISATVTTIMLFVSLRKKIGPIGLFKYLLCFAKTLAASLCMGIVVYLIYYKLGAVIGTTKLIQMVLLLGSVVVGAALYFGLCIVFKVKELGMIFKR